MIAVRILLVAALFVPASVAAEHDKRALADELLTVMRSEKLIDQVMQQVSASTQQQMSAMNVPPEMKAASEQMNKELMTYLRQTLDWTKLKPQFVDMYADVFSEDELRQVLVFYKSPAGQAFLDKTPQLMQRSVTMMQGLMADVMPHIQEITGKFQKQIEEQQKQEKPKIQNQ